MTYILKGSKQKNYGELTVISLMNVSKITRSLRSALAFLLSAILVSSMFSCVEDNPQETDRESGNSQSSGSESENENNNGHGNGSSVDSSDTNASSPPKSPRDPYENDKIWDIP
ncbi:MAG: hypothetical protein IKB34_06750 [Clostridia bacterium]|nr:hypothetical protein [Clostridia bacterium]